MAATETQIDQFDVLVIGAGISGIGAAYHLSTTCPDRSFAVLEARSELGGTWSLFTYPGIRSDSDMHTLGFSFKPWTADKAIADGPSILEYLHETVDEFDLRKHIRFDPHATAASWDSETATWTVTVGTPEGTRTYTCNFLFACSGYYSYKGGYQPDFPGQDDFSGQIVHPQHWPEDLDYRGKRVVVVGSGATAVTLVPSMANDVEHITMLQRSPSYVVAWPEKDVVANLLRKVLPDSLAYRITRKKNTASQEFLYKMSMTRPALVKRLLLRMARRQLGADYDIDTHFTPAYNPWDQRMCLVPDGDLFEAIRSGKASVVTDHIDRFTETGIALQSGETIEADIIVTATGLEMVTVGEMDISVDGTPVDFSQTWTYKGLGYSDVPNLITTFGYINASWTLRADMTSVYVCRLLEHMHATGTVQATPRLRPSDADMTPRPWIDGFSSGYMARGLPLLPRQGDRAPWLNTQRVSLDRALIAESPIVDDVMEFYAAKGARYGPAAMTPLRIWLDTDLGSDVDDALTLAYLLRHPGFDVVGISTVFGDVDLRTQITDVVLASAEATGIPVITGLGVPLSHDRVGRMFGHEGKGVIADAAPLMIVETEDDGDERIGALANALAETQPDVVVAIGPLTNIGALIAAGHSLPRLAIMGGKCADVLLPGMVEFIPEWNWFCDPLAVQHVVNAAHDVRPLIVPAEVTFQTRLRDGDAELLVGGDALANTVGILSLEWLDAEREIFKADRPKIALHDPLTAALLVEPGLCAIESKRIEVDANGATTIIDGTPNVDVAVDVDVDGLRDHLMDTWLAGT